jgi:hypothetical protein
MIVLFANQQHDKKKKNHSSLILGQQYLVFSMWFYACSTEKHVVVMADDYTPALFNIESFDFIDNRVPEEWGIYRIHSNKYLLGPSVFSVDFWNRYHDGDQEAEKIFIQVRKQLISFHGLDKWEIDVREKIKEIILFEWDPYGIKEIPGGKNEYDKYVDRLFEMIVAKKTKEEEIYNFLRCVEMEEMGVCGDKDNTLKISKFLLKIPIKKSDVLGS